MTNNEIPQTARQIALWVLGTPAVGGYTTRDRLRQFAIRIARTQEDIEYLEYADSQSIAQFILDARPDFDVTRIHSYFG